MPHQTITIADGSALSSAEGSVLVPYGTAVKYGDAISLNCTKGYIRAFVKVTGVHTDVFAALQANHFKDNIHPEHRHWANALQHLQSIDPNFTQFSKVSVVSFKVVDPPSVEEDEEVITEDEDSK